MLPDLAPLLADATAIARRAGDEILAIYEAGTQVAQRKADDSPLTAADLSSHALITTALQQLTPRWPILSEEASHVAYRVRRNWSPFWLVDPLDGTREFISCNGQFTVNIALVVDHRAVLGVVHVPVGNTTYYGAQSLGAFRLTQDGHAAPIHVQATASAPLRVVGSRSHQVDALGGILHRFAPHELLAVGSSLKFCLVAEGAADFYPRLGPTSEWDTAAGQAVLEAAGGFVVDAQDGQVLRYNRRDSLINPSFVAYADPACLKSWRDAIAT